MHPHLRRVLPLAVLLGAAAAQGDFDLDKTTSATLGGALQLAIRQAPPNALAILMPSFTRGPTPVALLDPNDLRSLQIGTDLFGSWTALFTDPAGAAGFGFPLPNVPAYAGTLLYWQAMTLPGANTIVDRISNDVAVQVGAAGGALFLQATLGTARAFAVPVQRGREVLLSGGGTGTLTQAIGLASTEIWDPRRLSVRSGAGMTSARALHVAVQLADGRTLLAGGVDQNGTVLASCEVYDPSANTFTPAAAMAVPRALHAGVRLADGRVMVAGGTNTMTDTAAAISNTLNSVEIYNPATNSWTAGPALGGHRLAPALTLLSSGRAMVSGGVQVTFLLPGLPIAVASTGAVQLANVAATAWSAGAAMPSGRAGHHYNQVTLADGRVLMSGGVDVPSLAGAANASSIAAAAIYDPVANAWTAANMAQARSLHSASLLPDGRVVVCGGAQGTLTAPTSIAAVEILNPTTNTWSPAPPLLQPRSGHVGVVQADGLLVLLGGQDAVGTTASVETIHF